MIWGHAAIGRAWDSWFIQRRQQTLLPKYVFDLFPIATSETMQNHIAVRAILDFKAWGLVGMAGTARETISFALVPSPTKGLHDIEGAHSSRPRREARS